MPPVETAFWNYSKSLLTFLQYEFLTSSRCVNVPENLATKPWKVESPNRTPSRNQSVEQIVRRPSKIEERPGKNEAEQRRRDLRRKRSEEEKRTEVENVERLTRKNSTRTMNTSEMEDDIQSVRNVENTFKLLFLFVFPEPNLIIDTF